MLSILLCQPIDPLVGTRRGIRAPLAPIRKKRREEGIEEGVFIDGRRPASTGD